MTKVKICGLCEVSHVQAAVEAGADAIGFVFAPSRRQVSIEVAKQLAAHIPEGILKIGVFVNAREEELRKTYEEVGLDFVQLHGDESNEFIQSIRLPTIKAFSVRTKEDIEDAKRFSTSYYLFDAPGIEYRGGSGVPFDWQLLQKADINRDKLILAGGLTISNVGQAIENIQPYMVDVSSGVEKDGRKDVQLIRAFINTVHQRK